MDKKFTDVLDFMVGLQGEAMRKGVSFNEQLAEALAAGVKKGASTSQEQQAAYVETFILSQKLQQMALQRGIDFNQEAMEICLERLEKKPAPQKPPSGPGSRR